MLCPHSQSTLRVGHTACELVEGLEEVIIVSPSVTRYVAHGTWHVALDTPSYPCRVSRPAVARVFSSIARKTIIASPMAK